MQGQNNIIEPINIFEVIDTDDKELCSICLDEMINPEGLYKIESCNHTFHTKCVLEMFINGINDFCPLCRTYITTNNNNHNFDNFKFNLIEKYSKKKNANKIVVNLFKKYNKYKTNLKILLKEKNKIIKNISLVKRNNKDIIKKNREYEILKTQIKYDIKPIKNIVKINDVIERNFIFRRSTLFKIIKENIKTYNLNISNIINDKLTELDSHLEENKKNEYIKEYVNLNKILRNITYKINEMTRQKNEIKRSIIQLPVLAQ